MMSDPQIGQTVELGPLALSRLGLDDAVDACVRRLERGTGGTACFVNVHTLTEATSDLPVRKALRSATYLFADGVPLLWLARAKQEPIAGRVCGPDFMDAMLRRERGRVHGLIGATPAITSAIARRFEIQTVAYSPPMRAFSDDHARADWAAFVEQCGGSPPACVWVALGAPKQERWIATVSAIAPSVMFFGVGAAFDFLAGHIPRAPRFMQRYSLEWLHRLAQEPTRLWSRYARSGTRFVRLAARELTVSRRS